MIEMLGVLAIIGVLSAGGIWGYNVAMERAQINKFRKDFSTMAQELDWFWSKNKNNTVIYSQLLNQAGILPDEYWQKRMSCYDDRECFKSPFGTPMRIDVARPNLFIKLFDVSKSLCLKLFTERWSAEKEYKAIIYSYGGTNHIYYSMPATREIAEAECKPYSYYGNQITLAIRINF